MAGGVQGGAGPPLEAGRRGSAIYRERCSPACYLLSTYLLTYLPTYKGDLFAPSAGLHPGLHKRGAPDRSAAISRSRARLVDPRETTR